MGLIRTEIDRPKFLGFRIPVDQELIVGSSRTDRSMQTVHTQIRLLISRRNKVHI